MLYARDVIRFEGERPATRRVVWADQRDVWLFDLDAARTAFSRVARVDLEVMLEERQAVIVTHHAHDARHVESALTDAQVRRWRPRVSAVPPRWRSPPEPCSGWRRRRVTASFSTACSRGWADT